ncbi:hypothetical protein [Sphingomonas sp.]|uniref:hypothetical protein n=1 Tax=Sphingomonas sp. TaxID=28214 RepID=UPI003CC606B1
MSLLRLALCWLFLTVLVSAGVRPAIAATRVSNIAQASWSDGGVTRSVSSNQVDLDVTASSVDVTLLRMDPGSTDFQTLDGRSCAAAAGAINAVVRVGVSSATTLTQGDTLVIEVDAPAANTDVARVDTITATVVATVSGDRETLTLHETGVDTGRFAAVLATAAVPPAATAGDCTLGLQDGDRVTVTVVGGDTGTPLATQTIGVPVDPRGKVFDSIDGGPVSGARVTLFDADTGLPAQVFASDLVTAYPSSVVSGQVTTDAAGTIYRAAPGMYQFPRVRPGRYRLQVEPPAPYHFASTATPAALATLARGNGKRLAIGDGSYGRVFTVDGVDKLRVDIPLDTPATPVEITKTVSRAAAAPGDVILYTVSVRNPDATHVRRSLQLVDTLPGMLRFRPGTVRIDGAVPAAGLTLGSDGRSLGYALSRITPGATVKITYAVQVRGDASTGTAINHAVLTDPSGNRSLASAAVRITAETIAGRMTLIGRVVEGCAADGHGIANVRVTLEDGSYAVTDRDGRYHFDGLLPGDHVAQADPATLPAGGRLVDCARSTRSAGNPGSRFVSGRGGSLVIADFTADLSQHVAAAADINATPAAPSDRAAAGAERDWFADAPTDAAGMIAWLFPAPEHNPRAPAVRVAIRHLPGQQVALAANGAVVDPIAFDGSRTSPDHRFAVSLWRGVPLTAALTRFTATVRNEDGSLARVLTRDVRFVSAAARATYLPAQSRLVADGLQRPLIAVRFTDAGGHPVHAGSVGDLQLGAPYETAQAIDAEQARALSGLERASPTWHVTGDDGVAYIALAPTTASGAVQIDFTFRDHDQVRRQRLDAWLSPGDRPWTVVGLAEGRLGRHVEPNRDSSSIVDGRLALYAKGRILGRWLLTLAYDSARRRQDQRLTGVIDPNTYYTVYGDRSDRRYDAASTRKLYLKLEARQFYALWGDFQTGFADTELTRYQRAGTGFKTEYRGATVAASAFAAQFPSTHRRDEIQGSGLSTGYRLRTGPILANSEQITVQVRDRLRSEQIVEQRSLTRFVDYDIDYDTGAIRFADPVLSRDPALNPQFIVVDYEVDSVAGDRVSAGARATWTRGGIRLGATVVRDGDGSTDLGGVDARVRLGENSEMRAELGGSRDDGHFAAAWVTEFEHHDARLDLLAYARQLDGAFGVAQQNAAERGRRKVGVDARLRLSERLSLSTSLWTDDDLTGRASRRAAKVEAGYRTERAEYRAGLTYAADHTAAGGTSSMLLEAGATRRLFDNRLELDARTSVPLGSAGSVDFAAQHRLGVRLQVSSDVALTATYEIATGAAVDARTARLGFDIKPWAGARLTSAIATQEVTEYGRRTYAAYGLAQSWAVTPQLSVDATLDGNHTLHGIDPARVVNPTQPVAAGGYVGDGATVTENFTAMTLGATLRAGPWAVTGRGEYRIGAQADRAAATLGVLRQLGDGATAGLLATWTRATAPTGGIAESTNLAGSLALRPAGEGAVLAKIEYAGARVDGVTNRRALASLSTDVLSRTRQGRERAEFGLFVGLRYAFDRVDALNVTGFSTMIGADARIAIGAHVELGGAVTVRGDLGRGVYSYQYGPAIGVRPVRDMLVTAGWNLHGFADRDFAAARTTRSGPYVTAKLKLDRNSFAFLGLGRR